MELKKIYVNKKFITNYISFIIIIGKKFTHIHNDNILFQKLYDIEHNFHKKNSKKLKPIFQYKPNSSNLNFSKTSYSLGKSLVNNISLTNENKKFHERINQKSSIYSVSKMDEQYKKSLEYKKNLAQITSVDFGNIVRKDQKVKSKKKINLQSNGNYHNIFNSTKFKPFIAFDAIPKKSKSNTIKNNRNNKTSNNRRPILTLNDKEKLKKLKEKKIREEKERKKKEIEKKKKEEEERIRKEEEEKKRKEEEEERKRKEEEENKRKEEEEKRKKEEEENKRKEEEEKRKKEEVEEKVFSVSEDDNIEDFSSKKYEDNIKVDEKDYDKLNQKYIELGKKIENSEKEKAHLISLLSEIYKKNKEKTNNEQDINDLIYLSNKELEDKNLIIDDLEEKKSMLDLKDINNFSKEKLEKYKEFYTKNLKLIDDLMK